MGRPHRKSRRELQAGQRASARVAMRSPNALDEIMSRVKERESAEEAAMVGKLEHFSNIRDDPVVVNDPTLRGMVRKINSLLSDAANLHPKDAAGAGYLLMQIEKNINVLKAAVEKRKRS